MNNTVDPQKEEVPIETTLLKAIHKFCLDCIGYSLKELLDCSGKKQCPLYPYRLGDNPQSFYDKLDRLQKLGKHRKGNPLDLPPGLTEGA